MQVSTKPTVVATALVAILAIVFASEALVMLALHLFIQETHANLYHALLDASLLAFVSAPLIWLILIGPLRRRLDQITRFDRAVVDTCPMAVFAAGVDGRIISWNRAAEKIFGYAREEVLGDSPTRLVAPNFLEQFRYFEDEARQGRAVEGAKFDCQHSDGHQITVEASFNQIRNARDQVIGMAYAYRDATGSIAEQRELQNHVRDRSLLKALTEIGCQSELDEAALQKGLDRLRDALQWPIAHMLVLRDDGKLQSANIWSTSERHYFAPFIAATGSMAFAKDDGLPGRVLATGRPEWIADPRFDLSPPRSDVARACGIRTAFALPVLIGGRVRAVIEFFAVAPIDFSPQIAEAAALACNILGRVIERRTAEKELDATRCEVKVATRLAETQAEDARAARAFKSEFLAIMNHEFRTPLTGVLGMLEILLDSGLNDQQLQFAENAHESAEVLLSAIRQILDLSSLDAATAKLAESPFDLIDTMERVVADAAAESSAADLDFAIVVAPDVPGRIMGDQARLEQVTATLIGESLRHTELGGITLDIRNRGDRDDRQIVEIAVRDTGTGIPEEAQANFFDLTTRPRGATGPAYGGGELGLALAKRLVELMGGEIGVTSDQIAGTTLWFTMAVQPAQTEAEATKEPLTGAKVLIAADARPAGAAMAKQVQMWGCEVVSAAGIGEAIELLSQAQQKAEPFSVVMVEEGRLDTSGTDWADTICEYQPNYADTTILVIRQYGYSTATARASARPSHVLIQPVGQSVLYHAVAKAAGLEAGPTNPLATSSRSADRAAKQRLNILVAEDNRINQMVIATLLQKLGHDVNVVANGLEALAAIDQKVYDLGLMDVRMPGIDGLEATRKIRSLDTPSATVPIIAISADAMTGGRELCRAAGMTDFLAKPIDTRDLALIIRKWGGAAPTAEATPAPERPPQSAAEPTGAAQAALAEVVGSLERLAGDQTDSQR